MYEYKISGVDLKISKDEFGYQEVLDDFKNAKKIRIVTFNITNNPKDKLFEKLRDLEGVDIQFITNIPSRLEWYATSSKGEYLKKTARNTIEMYVDKLNPKNFDNIVPFFNFNNHAKIIGTENIVYIGSQNFSVASANNYEAGIITRDKEFIKDLYKSFFEDLKQNSEPYFKGGYNEARLFISSILSRLTNHYRNIVDNLFREYKGKLIFINDETFIGINDLAELEYDLYELQGIQNVIENIDIDDNDMEKLNETLCELVSKIDTNEIIRLIEEESDIFNYVGYDYQNEFDKVFEQYSMEAYDEYLDGYVETANDEAREVLEDLCSLVESEVFELKNKLKEVNSTLKNALDMLERYYEVAINNGIDNTK